MSRPARFGNIALGTPPRNRSATPFVPALELYSGIILPRLADGPKSLAQLDVPPYAVHHLEQAGLVRSKMHTRGCIAEQYWYRAEDYPPPRRDCAEMDLSWLDDLERRTGQHE